MNFFVDSMNSLQCSLETPIHPVKMERKEKWCGGGKRKATLQLSPQVQSDFHSSHLKKKWCRGLSWTHYEPNGRLRMNTHCVMKGRKRKRGGRKTFYIVQMYKVMQQMCLPTTTVDPNVWDGSNNLCNLVVSFGKFSLSRGNHLQAIACNEHNASEYGRMVDHSIRMCDNVGYSSHSWSPCFRFLKAWHFWCS